MRRRMNWKRRKRKRRRTTREVEEADPICVHVGGEEVEKQKRSCMVPSVFLLKLSPNHGFS